MKELVRYDAMCRAIDAAYAVAYKEIRADAHPVVVIGARDIVEILRASGVRDVPAVRTWLEKHFP